MTMETMDMVDVIKESPPPSPGEDSKGSDYVDSTSSTTLANPLLVSTATGGLVVTNPSLFTHAMISAAAPTLLLGNSNVLGNDWVSQLKELQERGGLAVAAAAMSATRESPTFPTGADVDSTPESDSLRQYTSRNTGQPVTMDLCVVCGDRASGRHYGAISCEGCKGFFKRSIRKQLGYTCRGTKSCEVTKHHRNRCQYCRLQKCLAMGMRSDSVQSERKPATYNACSIDRRDKEGSPPTSLSHPHLSAMIDSPNHFAKSPAASKDFSCTPASFVELQLQMAKVLDREQEWSFNNGDIKRQDDSPLSSNGDGDVKPNLSEERSIKMTLQALAKLNGSENGITDGPGPGPGPERDVKPDLEGLILTPSLMPFNLTAPSPMPAYLNVHYICESASRLLFLSVHWARNIPVFQQCLSPEVQISLVRGCWTELFTLGMAQCSRIMSLTTILTAIISHLTQAAAAEKLSTVRFKQVSEHITRLQDFVASLSRLQLDQCEYAYLKTICLFSCDNVQAHKRSYIEYLQEKAAQELRNYLEEHYSNSSERYSRLLLKLPQLRTLQPQVMEELFFAGLIGNVQIDSVIPYIMKMEMSE